MNIPNIGNRLQKKPTDLVGIDFSTSATKVVRLKKNKDEISVTGIDLLPAVDFNASASSIGLPSNLTSFYGCLAYTAPTAVVRMLSVPLKEEENELAKTRIRELLNVDEDFRVSSMLIKRGAGRKDSSILAAAIPEDDVRFLLNMFPSGPPAPASVEVSGLALMPAFLHARGEECAEDAVCLVDIGDSISHFAFINKGSVVLVGKFRFGAAALRTKVMNDLGLDGELAANILTDASVNLSTTIMDVMAAFLKQLSISKDFIERHQGCRVSSVYFSGGVSLLPNVASVVEHILKAPVKTWSPFENMQFEEGIFPEELTPQLTRFAAAVGAAIGGFE